MGFLLKQPKDLWGSRGGPGNDKTVFMLGLDYAGRTTILYQLKLGQFIATPNPTIGYNLETLEFEHPRLGRTTITAYDVSGKPQIRHLWRTYYVQGTRGLIFVVDSDDRERIEEAAEVMQQVLNDDCVKKDLSVLVLANKQDLPNALSTSEVQRMMKLPVVLRDRDWNCMPSSARTGEGLWEALHWLAEALNSAHHTPSASKHTQPPSSSSDTGQPMHLLILLMLFAVFCWLGFLFGRRA